LPAIEGKHAEAESFPGGSRRVLVVDPQNESERRRRGDLRAEHFGAVDDEPDGGRGPFDGVGMPFGGVDRQQFFRGAVEPAGLPEGPAARRRQEFR